MQVKKQDLTTGARRAIARTKPGEVKTFKGFRVDKRIQNGRGDYEIWIASTTREVRVNEFIKVNK